MEVDDGCVVDSERRLTLGVVLVAGCWCWLTVSQSVSRSVGRSARSLSGRVNGWVGGSAGAGWRTWRA